MHVDVGNFYGRIELFNLQWLLYMFGSMHSFMNSAKHQSTAKYALNLCLDIFTNFKIKIFCSTPNLEVFICNLDSLTECRTTWAVSFGTSGGHMSRLPQGFVMCCNITPC